jgi:hypothetical protein
MTGAERTVITGLRRVNKNMIDWPDDFPKRLFPCRESLLGRGKEPFAGGKSLFGGDPETVIEKSLQTGRD